MNWLNQMKVALVTDDIATIGKLSQAIPDFRSLAEMKEAQALIGEGLKLLRNESGRLRREMEALKKNASYQQSRLAPGSRSKGFTAYS